MLTYFSKKVKLTVDDMEREVYGGELDAAERLLWRRWVENENARQFRKSRVQVTCCGRFRYRYQVEQDEHGNWWCDACWNAVPMWRQPPDAPPEETTLPARDGGDGNQDVPEGDVAAGSEKFATTRRDSERPSKKRRRALTGRIDVWDRHQGHGHAHFDGCHERVLIHAKDCIDLDPSSGAAVSALVHRRRDGKLQAFKVMSDRETMEERLDRVHSQLLGSS